MGPGARSGSPGDALETPDSEALAFLLDPDHHLVTEPGDHFRIGFDLPIPREPGLRGPVGEAAAESAPMYRLFLESTGY